MANGNFVVQNGLTIGPMTIDAATGSISTTGNITTTGTTTTFINEIVTGTEAVYGLLTANAGIASTSTTTGTFVVTGGVGVSGAIYNGGTIISSGNIVAASGTASTSATTGALIVAGGVGISGNVFTAGWIVPTGNTTQNLGTTSNWWGTLYGVSTQAKYADLAENYLADRPYNPGVVMMFSGEAEVTLADADTTRVAGIVSTNPAHLMNGQLTGPNVVALALTGRVPCNVIGPVAKGDIMVSAGFGFAKVNNAPQVGTVIGKALQDFAINGKGVIEIVVGRF